MKLKIKRMRENATLPQMVFTDDTGFDCYISQVYKIKPATKELILFDGNDYRLKPGERILCKLGFALELEEGYYIDVVPKSGLSLWSGITIVNSPGLVDNGYRGELAAIVLNTDTRAYILRVEEKICQMKIMRKFKVDHVEVVDELSDTKRGDGGFGSTGTK